MFLPKTLTTVLFIGASCLTLQDVKPAAFLQYDNELVSDINKLQFKEGFMNYAGSLDPYVMTLPVLTINKKGESIELWSRGFIAGGYIWSTGHSFIKDWPEGINKDQIDIVILGKSGIPGLIVDDKRDIVVGDLLYCSTITRGIIAMTVTFIHKSGNYIDVVCDKRVRHGDSGSPVLSARTDKVVGLISGLYTIYENTKFKKVAYISPIKNKYNELLAQRETLTEKANVK